MSIRDLRHIHTKFPSRSKKADGASSFRVFGKKFGLSRLKKKRKGEGRKERGQVDTLEHRDTYGQAQVQGCSKGHQGRSEFFLINQIQPSQSDFFYISQNSGSS